MEIITEAARDFGAVLPMAEHANKIYADAVEAGFGEIDYTGILAYIKKLSEDWFSCKGIKTRKIMIGNGCYLQGNLRPI